MKASPLTFVSVLFSIVVLVISCQYGATNKDYEECNVDAYNENNSEALDPALKPMKFDVGKGDGVETFMAYVTPDISSFYREKYGSRQKQIPHNVGLAGKFINLSPDPLCLFWDAGPSQRAILIAVIDPFQSVGSGTFEGHEFYLTPFDDPDLKLIFFHVKVGYSLYVYDPLDPRTGMLPHIGASSIPIHSTSGNGKRFPHQSINSLSSTERITYNEQKANLRFAKYYRDFTGRDWLGFYKRPPPSFRMWPADYFGQIHRVVSKDAHFVIEPPPSSLGQITEHGRSRVIPDTEPRLLQAYRSSALNKIFTLKVLSCAPRIFEIDNFLSTVEVNHLLDLTKNLKLSRSTTKGGLDGEKSEDTRTSSNVWIYRESSPIVDSIYRRIADILGIDEALLRFRDETELSHMRSSVSIAEALQIVHYARGQGYSPHHDFGFPPLIPGDYQMPARFATFLLYLNEGMEGGHTSFPKYMNAETRDPLYIEPKIGKAILFYSFLPDGNHDDFSLHSAMPVLRGEKWLTNVWIWDPVYPQQI